MTTTRPVVREVGLPEGIALARHGAVVVDVREPVEWQSGHVDGAIHVPLADVEARIGEVLPDPDTPVLLYCAVGARSRQAAATLGALGYTQVASLRARIDEWPDAGGPWVPAEAAIDERYARQVLLPEIGVAGQQRLHAARVVLVGAGGLGSPVALYLAAAGIGTLSIVDDDTVEPSNLGRQVLHPTHRVGTPKIESAARSIRAVNPDTTVEAHAERLDASNVEALIAGADVVVDGTDNLATRYVLNDAAVWLRVPVVHGSIYRWHGQVTTLVPFDGPCYRCVHPEPPPAELAPDCAVAGVVGVLPGLIGMLQATEALKVILGIGEPLVGRVLLVDALGTRFEEMRVSRDPACPACGTTA